MANGLFLKDKQAKILITLRNVQQPWYISTLAKASDSTYVHASKFLSSCEKMGLVKNEKHGKIKEIKLTERGMQLAETLASVYSILNQAHNDAQQKQQKEQPKPPVPQVEPEKK